VSDSVAVTQGHPGLHRPLALLVLLVTGVLSIPVAAAFLDGGDSEGLVVPAAVVLMLVVGAVVGSLLPGLAGEHATAGRARLVGAVTGAVMVALGALVFYVLLNG
jgi:hypothetical protein